MEQDPGPDPVGRLRTLATDHARAGRWADVLALEPDLRADEEFWWGLWGPVCAIARWHCGRADARDLLEECIAAILARSAGQSGSDPNDFSNNAPKSAS